MSKSQEYVVFKRGGEKADADWLDCDWMSREELQKYIEDAQAEGAVFLETFVPVTAWDQYDRMICKLKPIVLQKVEREITRKVTYLVLPEEA